MPSTCDASFPSVRRVSHVAVRLSPLPDAARARYGLEQLLRIIGVRPTFEPRPDPTLYYGADPQMGNAAAIWIPARQGRGGRDGPPEFTEIDGVPIPLRDGPPAALWNGNRLAFDVALAASDWLTLESERHVRRRDAHGRVPGQASLLAAAGRLDRPPLHAYARLLADRLASCGACERVAPRWPHGKRYAVALSHDVDAPERPSRWPSLLKDLTGGGPRARRDAYWDFRADIRSRGVGDALLNPPTRRREWDFAKICSLERRHGLRSAFYFAVVGRAAGHPCDVGYDACRRRYRKLYRTLLAGGWEVGLHAAYGSHASRPLVQLQYAQLAILTDARIAGVRHHYLRLDSRNPMRTLAAHAAAGAIYDTTLGFNDCPGFRLGIALPFQPYDPDTRSAMSLLELPMTIADMHLPRQDRTAAISAVLRHLEVVRALGGLAVLNWHVGNWHAATAWRDSYRAACRLLADDPDVWVAPPQDIAAWWHRRTEALR